MLKVLSAVTCIWDPGVRQIFDAKIKEHYKQDRYALAIKVDRGVVGHVPQV